jgi:hypothetical protein
MGLELPAFKVRVTFRKSRRVHYSRDIETTNNLLASKSTLMSNPLPCNTRAVARAAS